MKRAILEAEERRRREEEEKRKREEERQRREEQECLAREQRERELAAERERRVEIERVRAEERAKVQKAIEMVKSESSVEPIAHTYLWNANETMLEKIAESMPEIENEIAFPGTEEEEEELEFPGTEESASFPSSDIQESEDKEIDFASVKEEQVVFKKYLVKATEKQHDLIMQTLNGLGVYWSE